MIRLPAFAVALALSVATSAEARVIPAHSELVVDEAGILGYALKGKLIESLHRFQREHGPQLQVLTVPSLEGEPIESFSIRVADDWKLGTEKKDDGLILIVSLQDRAVRIEVGQGLEGQLPDVTAGRIIREDIIPRFRQGAYEAGIVSGLQAIAGELGGSLQGVPSRHVIGRPSSGRGGSLLFFLILFFFVLPRFFGGGGLGRRRHGSFGSFVLGMILGGLSGRSHRGGFGGGGFGGGGFGGFGGGGGGGFSGGGASGKW